MLRIVRVKYSEDQPRAPAGGSDGGQFTSGGGGGGGSDAVSGLPTSVTLAHASLEPVRTALARGAFTMTAVKTRDDTYEVTILPNDIPATWVTTARGQVFDPKFFTVDPDFGRAMPLDRAQLDPPQGREEGFLFRGMSHEEYQKAAVDGYVQSRGSYNLGGDQEGLTYFSKSKDQAAAYASGFAPWEFKPTVTRPAMIVKIKDPGGHVAVAGTGADEVGLRGRIPFDRVVGVRIGRPVAFTPGWQEIREDLWATGKDKFKAGSSVGFSASVVWSDEKLGTPKTYGALLREVINERSKK